MLLSSVKNVGRNKMKNLKTYEIVALAIEETKNLVLGDQLCKLDPNYT